MSIEKMPDAALLWARESAAKWFDTPAWRDLEGADEGFAAKIRAGQLDHHPRVALRAESFRAGQAHERRADAGLLAALEALTFAAGDYGHMTDREIADEAARFPGVRIEAEIAARAAIAAAKGHDHAD